MTITKTERDRLRAYLQSIAIFAVEGQNRLNGDQNVAPLNELLGEIRSDLEQAERIAAKDETL